jgi:predicted protein tyrosine phosphatase
VEPRRSVRSHENSGVLKILFVCSRNRLRSLTAERLFDGVNGHEVRSAGTEQGARIRVTAGHLGWADLVVAMEKRHVSRLRDKFADALDGRRLICLHIPDEYVFMDPALVERLEAEMAPYLVRDE